LGLFANVRPVRPHLDTAASASSLRPSALEGVDLVVVRELTSGLYFGEPRGRRIEGTDVVAFDTAVYRTSEIQAIAEFAFNLAQQRGGRVTSVDKANVLETSRLWREVVDETHVRYPDVKLDHQLVDSAAMRLITHAREFDIILTSNMFGDILSDEASVLAGSIGVLPSASLGAGSFGLYEPIHGSAPDIAGQGIANPVGMILSAAMMLRHSLDRQSVACRVENAVQFALDDGHRTKDLGGTLTTKQMTEAIKSRLGD
ncbi:MAG: 3-isopropylmalate dehydrogenase, partial [Myxococcota bacterium]